MTKSADAKGGAAPAPEWPHQIGPPKIVVDSMRMMIAEFMEKLVVTPWTMHAIWESGKPE